MSKKDYIEIGRILGMFDAKPIIVSRITDHFEKENKLFNRQKFFKYVETQRLINK